MTDASSHDSSQEPFLHPGDMVEKYRIESLIGYGGMGEVYLATHVLLNRQCALKILPPEIARRNPNHGKRFLREAKLATRFKHPNIIEVWDVGQDPATGVNYIAMEYVRGQTIAEWLVGGPLDEKNVLIIATRVAEVLEVAQRLNIVHRDIKPSNIMITEEGDVKVADLGIAKSEPDSAAGESSVTLLDTVLGTPFYASPEQCRAAHQVTIQSDIYSLGATMYHMLTGVKPYVGENSFEVMAKVLEQDPAPVQKVNPKVSPGTSRLVARMMAKQPENRPANPSELLKQLDALRNSFWARHPLSGQVIVGCRRLAGASWLACWRHRRRIALAVLLLVVLAGLGYGGVALFRFGRQLWGSRAGDLPVVADTAGGMEPETAASSEPEPAPEPEVYLLPEAGRPLHRRLGAARQRLAGLEAELANAGLLPSSRILLRRQALFRKMQIMRLEEQAVRREVTLAAGDGHDTAATAALGRAVEVILADPGWNDAAAWPGLSGKLLAALQEHGGNPNAVLARLAQMDPGAEQTMLLAALYPEGLAAAETSGLLEELTRRCVDVNLIPAGVIASSLAHGVQLPAKIIGHGLEEVDGPAPGQYLLAAMQLPGPAADALCRELLLLNCSVNTVDRRTGQTPLHLAVAQSRLELAAMLVYADAAVNARNRDGLTPLQLAQATGNVALQTLLRSAGGQ